MLSSMQHELNETFRELSEVLKEHMKRFEDICVRLGELEKIVAEILRLGNLEEKIKYL